MSRPRHRDGQVLDEGMERIRHVTIAVDEVEHLVEQHEGWRAGRREHAAESLGARRRGRRVRSEQLDASVSGELPGDVDPRCLPPFLRIPGVADEDRHPRLRRGRQPRVVQQIADLLQVPDGLPGRHQVVKRRQGVGLAPAELRHQRHHRRRVGSFPRQAPEHHPRVLAQRPREARAREERPGIAVVRRGRAADDLLQGDGELVRVERASFADLFARERDLVPGLKRHRVRISSRYPTDSWHRSGFANRLLC